MKRIYLLLISMLSGVLLWAAWPTKGFTPLIFIAWVPLLWVEDYVLTQQRKKDAGAAGVEFCPRYHIFLYAYCAFLVWNVLTTWWVWNSTPAAVFAFLANAALMAGTFALFHFTCRRFFKKGTRWIILLLYWLAFEFAHLHWDLSWPWLMLGNVFATTPQWVQWYEVTGPLGGALWVLVCNIALLGVLKAFLRKDASKKKPLIAAAAVILLPLTVSLIRFHTYKENGREVETVVVQPNIDPYTEQFSLDPCVATLKMLSLAQSQTTPATAFIVTPESMIQEYVWEEALPETSPSIELVSDFMKDFPNGFLVAGISSFSRVSAKDSNEEGVRRLRFETDPEKKFYRAHNTVVAVGNKPEKPLPLHHKSRLTPGVELMPFAGKVKFIEKMAVNLGGTVGSLGVEEGPHVFDLENGAARFSDIICYESVFPDYVASCVNAGAELLFVSTNDGWWGNSPGHRQHAAYARLRAVENRRDIARSANTGISCFINQRGEVLQNLPYEEDGCIRQTQYARTKQTFYSKYGEILGKCSLFLSLLFLSLTLIYRIFPAAWRDFRREKSEM